MDERKANRISRLEERRAITDQKESFCFCRCHKKTLGDFMEITDEFAEEVWKIFERYGSYKLPDGTWRTRAEDLLERIANSPKCSCECSH